MLKLELLNQYGAHSLLVSMEESQVLLDPSEIDALIENLSSYRTKLQPAVPTSISKSHKYVIETNPIWHTEGNPLLDGAVVFMRHTGFGWAGFAIPRASLKRFIETVSACARGERTSNVIQ